MSTMDDQSSTARSASGTCRPERPERPAALPMTSHRCVPPS